MTLLETAALRADLHHREVGRVVDEEWRFTHHAHLGGELLPVRVAHVAAAHVMQCDLRFGGQQTHEDLVTAHLQREDDAGQAVLDAG